ncbi:hypothetical protein [Flavobacterium aestuarii]|uniref:hypothetical protein n=1 Tax=Flavobacterium aestuarii TaxID=3149227 RepID=UPI0032B5DC13
MEKIIPFIKANYLLLLVGLFFYGLFVYYNETGSRICDCESTENYKPTSAGRSINHFYHK